MSSIILQTAARAIEPLMLLLSIYLFTAGHDLPGGGFVGGLVAAAALVLHAIAFGVASARQALRVEPRSVAAVGLGVCLLAAWAGVAAGRPPMTGLWAKGAGLGVVGAGTPVLFDAGVFLVVVGSVLNAVFSLSEEAP